MHPDSLAVAHATVIVTSWLQSTFPFLNPAIVDVIARGAASSPIIPTILSYEFLLKKLNESSPWVYEKVGKRFEQFSWAINPVLGALVGAKMGDASLGLVAGGLYTMVHSAIRNLSQFNPSKLTTTVEGLKRGKYAAAVVAVMCLAFALAGTAGAQEKPAQHPYKLAEHMTFAIGAGVEQNFDQSVKNARGVLGAQVGYQISDHVGIRLAARRPQDNDLPARAEAMLWLTY